MENTGTEENIEKKRKAKNDSLRDLWDNMKCTNICIIGIPEEEERKNTRKYFKTQ